MADGYSNHHNVMCLKIIMGYNWETMIIHMPKQLIFSLSPSCFYFCSVAGQCIEIIAPRSFQICAELVCNGGVLSFKGLLFKTDASMDVHNKTVRNPIFSFVFHDH